MSGSSQQKTHGLAITSLVLGCLFLIPILGVLFSLLAVIFGIIALTVISKNKETYKGGGLAIGGIILGAVGIIMVPILMLLAAIAIPNLLRARVNANEAYAMNVVRTVSTAAESYKVSNGQYPSKEEDLVSKEPQYINESYNNKTLNGYNYSVAFSPDSYTITASPEKCFVTGAKIFTMQNGELSESKCKSSSSSDY
ncbi:MAG: DUF4190 domain-containing protein [Candidatus Omnitrophota bacterium]|jgi:Tfp pilus assembly protein PilE